MTGRESSVSIKKKTKEVSYVFKVNQYISLKLEEGRKGKETVIYVDGKRFNQCKFLLLNIPIDKIKLFDEIESVDEASERLDRSLEKGSKLKGPLIPPEIEFWGHCSNLQVWFENDYNTRLIHSNLAFPLLEKLTEVGDPLAKKVFKEEIAERFLSEHLPVMEYLRYQNYMDYLNEEEMEYVLDEALKITDPQVKEFVHIYYQFFALSCIRRQFPRENNVTSFGDKKKITGLWISCGTKSMKEIKMINQLDKLTELKKLKIRFLKIKKINGLENLTQLEELELSRDEISEIKGLETLRNLKKLDLSHNNIEHIQGLENLTQLEELELIFNKIISIGGLEHQKNLKSLSLRQNQINEIKNLDNLKNLKELRLDSNQISEIKGLENLNNLEELNLLKNQIREIKGLKNLKNLKKLNLEHNQISEIKNLKNLKNLEFLILAYNQIHELKELSRLKKLRSVELQGNYHLVETLKRTKKGKKTKYIFS
ncbi:hypothetical protein ES706_03082 [subsurface metagenome]